MGDDAHSMRMSRVRPGYGERHPLTEAQAEKWLGSRYSDGAALAFGEGFELAFDGDLDVEALSTAFAEVMERHEALSMRFEADGSAQVYEPPSGIGLRYFDFRNDHDPHAAYAAFCAERTAEPFDPAAPPLVRAWLCRLGAAQWRLLLRAHHLVVDGWSLRIVLQDLAGHYNRLRGGAGSVPAVDSWIDYVRAERERHDGEPGRASLAYWLDKYRELPEPLRLPTDRARAPRLSFAAGTIEHAVPDGLWPQLRTVARAQGVTRFSLLLAGYLLLLHRLTGQCDLVCGIPFAGAARGGGARVVGDTDNTLPLRIRVVPEEPLSVFVSRVHDAMREAALHQDVSLGRIVRALPLVREPGRLLLVDSILTLNPAIERLRFDGVDCRMRVMPHQAAAWELAWQWRPLAGGMVLEVQYHSDLYLPTTIHDWCDAYLGLLGQIMRGDDVRVDDVGAADIEGSALADDRRRGRDDNGSLPDLLQEALSRYSGRRAARCGEHEIGYAALDRASRVAASALRSRGVVAGQLVGICMARSIDMLVAVLAVLRSGAAYVPLDPSFPPERLRWMAEHARLGVIVADDAQRLPQGLAREAEVMRFADLAIDDGCDAALPEVAANDLAYVLYTSGSTGEPKGVRILHRNLVNFLRAMREAPGFDAGDVLCAATTLSFDIAALELYLPLLCGGSIVIADDREHRDPEALARLIERHGCTVLQTTPSLLALLLEVKRDHVLRPLKLLVGGEAFPPALARTLLPRCRELWNMYGPTETTVWSTVARIDAVEDAVPLGTPIADTRIYLLDARGRPSLPGALGEIWIGGAGVADGYLHRPDLTAERFLDDPFAADGSRIYRTGDVGRIRDGKLYFHGRVDEQIKLRGYRIEPAEIEAAAAGEAGVIECVAVARDAGNGDQVLVLYAGSDAAPDALAARLRQRCARSLPAYMRPQHVVVLQALPKTPNGKIDRRALPAPDPAQFDLARADRAGAYAATPLDDPRDPLQVELRDAWRRLLRRDVGVHDNFFELGGYSLLAVRLFAELHERHGVDLPLSTLIERPTIAGLAEALREAMRDRDGRQSSSRSGAFRPPANDGAQAQSFVAPDSTLVELRAGGESPPLFLAHAVGGNVLNYLPIASAAEPGRAVYGLQSPGLDGAEAPLATIEAMATRYARAIRGRQPHGPYLLAGGSMGGVLALEIARLLREGGDEIAFLGMFDTWCPGASGWAGESPWRPHRWWSLYRGLDAGQRAALWRRIGFRVWQLPMLRLREWLGRGTVQELRRHRVESSNQNALAAYRPRPYAGGIVLFRAMQAGSGDATLGWSGIADGVDVIELGGRHDTILEQPDLPRRVRECIAAHRPDFDRETMSPEYEPEARRATAP